MTSFEEFEDEPLEWRCPAPGLQAGVDCSVDALLTLRATAIVRDREHEARTAVDGQAPDTVSGVCDIRLEIDTPPGIGVAAISDLERDGAGWRLPDLSRHDELDVAMRLSVPAGRQPSVASMMLLATARITASIRMASGAAAPNLSFDLRVGLPVLSDSEYSDTPGDEGATVAVERAWGRSPEVRPTARE